MTDSKRFEEIQQKLNDSYYGGDAEDIDYLLSRIEVLEKVRKAVVIFFPPSSRQLFGYEMEITCRVAEYNAAVEALKAAEE